MAFRCHWWVWIFVLVWFLGIFVGLNSGPAITESLPASGLPSKNLLITNNTPERASSKSINPTRHLRFPPPKNQSPQLGKQQPISQVPAVQEHDATSSPSTPVHGNQVQVQESNKEGLDSRVHAFYYAWYGSPEHDNRYIHWNHEYIPHWNANIAKQYPHGNHDPTKNDIGADFFPALGTYSSADPSVMEQHMRMAQQAGIGVLSLSWYPPGKADNNGLPSDPLVKPLLDAAIKFGIKICLHIEPYKDRNPHSVKKDMEYAIRQYGDHPAFYRTRKRSGGEELPVFYVYDSYHNSPDDWREVLAFDSKDTIRQTEWDSVVLFLFVESSHARYADAGFDGFYTYFASDGFTYGSTTRNWKHLANIAEQKNIHFVPSVGPGYKDVSVRPWNAVTTKAREDGNYYSKMWEKALSIKPSMVSITSFNEWHEGTQIEPAVPANRRVFLRGGSSRSYDDYGRLGKDGYLDLTKEWISKFQSN